MDPPRPWRTGICATLQGQGGTGPVALTIRKYNTESVLLEAKCESVPGVPLHQQLLSQLVIFEELLELTLAQRWSGCVPQVFALLPGSNGGFDDGGSGDDGAEVSLADCLGCLMRDERTLEVRTRAGVAKTAALEQLVVLQKASVLTPAVQSKLAMIRFLGSLAASVLELPELKSVVAFRGGLEARMDLELGGTFLEDKRWSDKLSPILIGDDPQEQEQRCQVDGTGRALGLLLFLNHVYKHSVKLISEGKFTSMDELSEWLLGPFPWLEGAARELAQVHNLRAVPQLSSNGLFQSDCVAPIEYEAAVEGASRGPNEQHQQQPMFGLSAGKEFHFFICHHQGSGGDQSNYLCIRLKQLGYSVWYDNGQNALHRNLEGMRKGIRLSVCLLIFLSGRKETNTLPDLAGEYEGPFTRWFCNEEMATAHEEQLRCIGVMETEDRRGKPDFALERSRALTGGRDNGPVHPSATHNVRLLDDVCFIPLRRQEHEVSAMLAEIQKHALQAPKLTPFLRTVPLGVPEGVPPLDESESEPEPEPESVAVETTPS